MKINIEVTKDGYTKTLTTADGIQHKQTFISEGFALKSTEDSVDFDDLDITDDLLDSINDINYELFDMCFALVTEGTELPHDHQEAITKDGHKLERGDTFYGIGVTSSGVTFTPRRIPLRHIYPQDWDVCSGDTYYDRRKCVEVCDFKNQKHPI